MEHPKNDTISCPYCGSFDIDNQSTPILDWNERLMYVECGNKKCHKFYWVEIQSIKVFKDHEKTLNI